MFKSDINYRETVFIDRKVYKIFKWYFIIEIRKFVKAEYWDCECERRYIHPSSDIICPTCGAEKRNSPDSIRNEIRPENIYQFRE